MNIEQRSKIQKEFQEKMDYDELLNCMRCGFCLPSCPTYLETSDEVHSPRGRIALMKAVVDGDIEPDEDVKKSLDMCLGCRACEPVCPSGVNYGHLLEQARDIIYQNEKLSISTRFIRRTTLKGLFPYQNRMITMTSLLGFYQKSGLRSLTRKSGIMNLLPEHLAYMEKVLPDVPSKSEMKNRPRHFEPVGQKKKRVAFFSGCLMDTLFLKTNGATTKLLQYAGCEIVIPENQACCGALQGHSGEKNQAKEMAKRNIQAFEDANVDYIITNAGGCGSFLVDYHFLLKDDPAWTDRAKQLSEKIKDITRILVELDFHKKPLHIIGQIITYQDSCHLRNGQKTYTEPRLLLESINGSHFVEMKDADRCCGSAGIYNIIQSDMSMKILDYKMKHTTATGATTVVTTNPGCLLQMKLGIEKEGLSKKMKAVHIVDLLLEAYETALTKEELTDINEQSKISV
ncbi:(Fe-S)-binding protein [Litchfieldia alkalitelluris]|uniref:(Fe-S)-binding protein n=1 Tax=Litchfieldia alkalitelluris TaxID=304268 RepID=UPI000996CF08|nr:(Fe-S)-binding protein [Litchfieldia alkalitelluris]